jgi:hypothetical protein
MVLAQLEEVDSGLRAAGAEGVTLASQLDGVAARYRPQVCIE